MKAEANISRGISANFKMYIQQNDNKYGIYSRVPLKQDDGPGILEENKERHTRKKTVNL